jgi:brefeldin A-inhibited guanine nucleotide-exchange protein
MFTKIIIPMLDSSNPTTYYQRISAARSLMRCFSQTGGGKLLVELYLNYDCDVDAGAEANIWERFILSICQTITSNSVEMTEPHHFDFSVSPATMPAITTKSLSNYSKDQVRQLYLPTGDTAELKMKFLDLLVRGIMLSLSIWCKDRQSALMATSHRPEDSEADDPVSFEMSKNKKTRLAEGIKLFNQKPNRAIRFLVEGRVIPSSAPRHIAHFLLNCPGLDKKKVGDYLGEGEQHNISTMHAFVDYLDFSGLGFVEALRLFLSKFWLPGEAQKIDRFMLKFAEKYLQGNPNTFKTADTAYVLAYSVIMLNTDMYNPQVKKKMTCEEFIRNNRGINEGKDLDVEFVTSIYNAIAAEEIQMKEPSTVTSSNHENDATRVGNRQQNTAGIKYYKNESIANLIRTHNGSTRDPKSLDDQFLATSRSEFIAAHQHAHVKPMFQLIWMSVLMSVTSFFQNHDEIEGVFNALEGFKHCIHISCVFDLDLERKAFLSNVSKFVELPSLLQIKEKNIEACKTLLEIAYENGNYFDNSSWATVVKCMSQLEYHLSQGLLTPDKDRSNDQKKKDAIHLEKVFYQISSQAITLSVDRLFTSSVKLDVKSITSFVKALCSMSWDEIISSSSRVLHN